MDAPRGRRGAIRLTDDERKRARSAALFIALTGVAAPWAAALGVLLYRYFRGMSLSAFSSFLKPEDLVITLGGMLIMWSSPFLVLAHMTLYGTFRFGEGRNFRQRLRLSWIVYLAGMPVAIFVYTRMFMEPYAIYFFLPDGDDSRHRDVPDPPVPADGLPDAPPGLRACGLDTKRRNRERSLAHPVNR